VNKKSAYIENLKAGEKVNSSFLVAEKNLAYSQKGAPYLNIRLKDKTGEIDGKVWDNAGEWDGQFKKGDIVQVYGRTLSYKNNLQLSVLELKRLTDDEIDLTDYFPAAKQVPDEMFSELMTYVETIRTPFLKSLLDAFFDDEKIRPLFKRAPAAKGFHHVYLGGLLEHTLSVTKLLDTATQHYKDVNRDLLLTGGLLHDIGKIYEFDYDRLVQYSDEGRLIGHIVMGVEMVNEKIALIEDFPKTLAMELRHLILSHHGVLEFGSPKRPKTLEALIVHHIDDLDAKVNAFQTFVDDAPEDDTNWTPFHKLLERFIYKRG
jgi:3'-5' exoribonuclease